MTVRTISIGVVAFAAVSCRELAPTAPDLMTCTRLTVNAAQGNDDPRTASAAAVADSRQRIIPALRADSALGEMPATRNLAAALDDLAATLTQRRNSTDRAAHQAIRALRSLEDAVAGDAGRAADVSVVRLAVEQACQFGN